MYILGGKLYGICRVVMRNGMENIFMCGLCRDRLDVFYPFLSTALHYDTNACPLIVGDASFRCVLAMPFILTPRYELQRGNNRVTPTRQLRTKKCVTEKFYKFLEKNITQMIN